MSQLPETDRPDAVYVMRKLGLEPDPWQVEVLRAGHSRILLNCCRQAGKSTTVAILALVEALSIACTKVVLVSRSHRQSREVYRKVTEFHRRLGDLCLRRRTSEELTLTNQSRIVSLPCREDTIRGYSHVTLLVIDEAARVPDDIYRAVRPMLAVSGGRLMCLSTPFGKRGFFYEGWTRGGDDWVRIEVPAQQVPRIKPAFLEVERRELGEASYQQEYCCSFEALEGLVYPDFARCVVAGPAPEEGRHYGGIDFGFRNPFAALWGVHDRDDILWITGEHYLRQRDVGHHAQFLPRRYLWFGDPSGANETATLVRAGVRVRPGKNALAPGIAAVAARLRDGTLRVVQGACPNLLAEAQLYRYRNSDADQDREEPVSEHNHALDALRYLVMGIDGDRPPRRRAAPGPDGQPATPAPPPAPKPKDKWLRYDNEVLWTPIR